MKHQRKLSNAHGVGPFHDWANSAFGNNSHGWIFTIFFKSCLASDLPDAESTFIIGSANSLVGLLIAISAPVKWVLLLMQATLRRNYF